MGRTLVSAIIAAHSSQKAAEGEICQVKVDFAFANDITGAPAAASFREMGADRVFDPERCAFLPDHFTPNKDIASAEQSKIAHLLVDKVTVSPTGIKIDMKTEGMKDLVLSVLNDSDWKRAA